MGFRGEWLCPHLKCQHFIDPSTGHRHTHTQVAAGRGHPGPLVLPGTGVEAHHAVLHSDQGWSLGFCRFILCGGFSECPNGTGPCEGHTQAMQMYNTPAHPPGVTELGDESGSLSKAVSPPRGRPPTREATGSPDLSREEGILGRGTEHARWCHRLRGLRQHGSGDQKSKIEVRAQPRPL